MIQYNNFLMKREQSRAGSRFAECEKSRLKAKILITLALLLTAVTGAWAQEESESITTVKTGSAGAMTCTGEHFTITGDYADGDGLWIGNTGGSDKTVTIESKNGENITKIEAVLGYVEGWGDTKLATTSGKVTGTYELGQTITISSVNATTVTLSSPDSNFKLIEFNSWTIYYGDAPITVEPVEGKTNEWTFSMPGSDVVLTPQYAPAAQLDENGAPAPVSGLEIAADAAIITAGQSAQGTLLYAVGTSETEKPALTAFAATLPNAKDLTAAGNYYVWYYIQGQDTPQDQEPTAENTFNDSEIMGPVTVELLTNEHTLNIKQSPNITVTVAGTAVTPTDDKVTPVTTGQEVKIKAKEGYKFRKVEVKKGAPDVKIESFSIHTSSDHVYSGGTFTCSIIDILPANATNQTFEWNINSGAPAGTTIKTVSDDTKSVTIQAGAVSGSITIEATAKDGGGANKLMHITVME